MSKDNKCASKQSCISSKSDNCESNCKNKCEDLKECECYSSEEIACLFKDAVVEIHSEFILLGAGLTGATGGTPLTPGGRADIILEGNGFFIKGHYIVAPAQLVLLPPSLTSVVNRYPFFNAADLTLGQIENQIIRASRILVSVFNVNNRNHSFVYEADLVGVDGAGDIAVLRINYKKQWNLCNPCIEKCHPYFKLGSSRASKDGEKVYLIGDYVTSVLDRRIFNAVGAIADGLLSDHRYIDYTGFFIPELILVSAPAYAFSSGLPIINCQGQVIGMQVADIAAALPFVDPATTLPPNLSFQAEGIGFVAGVSEFFLRRVVKTIIRGTCSRKWNCQLETICDPVGSYYRYRKGYVGVAYDVFTGVDYDTTSDYTSGLPISGLPRVRLSPSGEFLSSPPCKELVGVRVLGLAGANPTDANGILNGFWYVPGGTGAAPLPSFLPISPFLGKLQPGDVITHIEGVALGDLNKQITPSLITWRLCEGDQIEICFRRGGNALNAADNSLTENYENLYTHTVCLHDFPPLMDYPWAAVNLFPLLATRGFIFPGGQIINPQYPALQVGAPFHPAF